MKDWYYLDSNNQQVGPFTTDEIKTLSKNGQLNSNSFIWKNGMDNWKQINEISDFIVPEHKQITPPQITNDLNGTNKHNLLISQSVESTEYINEFLYFYMFLIFGSLGTITLLYSEIYYLISDYKFREEIVISTLIGSLLILPALVFMYIYIYKIWKVIKSNENPITPGKAVGFLFIPFYGFYWIFIAAASYPEQFNKFLKQYQLNNKRIENKHFYIALSISWVAWFLVSLIPVGKSIISFLFFLLWIIILTKDCKAINELAAKRNIK